MRIVLRKSTRIWLVEIGNITLGVLIALGLGWIAAEVGWQRDVAEARQALRLEVGKVVVRSDERRWVTPCIERRLDQLAILLDRAATSGRLPAIGAIGMPPVRTWSRGLWDDAVGPEVKAHFRQDEREYLSGVYELITPLSRYTPQEIDAWTRLHGLIGPGRATDAREIAEWRAAIGQARMIDRSMLQISQFAAKMIAEGGIARDESFARNSGARFDAGTICGPIGPAGRMTYGAAPFEAALGATKQR